MPKIIRLNEIPGIIAEKFRRKRSIVLYPSSNAAVPTASLEVLMNAIKAGEKFPRIDVVSLLMLGAVPYVAKELAGKVTAYSVFSSESPAHKDLSVRQAINEGRAHYLPCTLANMESLIGSHVDSEGRRHRHRFAPDAVITKVCQNPFTGEFSLGLSVEAMRTAIREAKIVIAELDNRMPFTFGDSVINAASIDYLIEDDKILPPETIPVQNFNDLADCVKKIGELVVGYFVKNGMTIQIGIGAVPNAFCELIAQMDYIKDLGIQTELYSDGLMHLEETGKVTNIKKSANMGYSTTALIMGSQELYDFAHMRAGIQLRSCTYTNSEEVVRKNAPFLSVNTAMGISVDGTHVWADCVNEKRHWGGVGGQPDFIRALSDPKYGVAVIIIPSITDKGVSKIVKAAPQVTSTAASYDNFVVVSENGIADLRGLALDEKAIALANIAHPNFRAELLQHIYENPILRPKRKYIRKPKGLIPYRGL